MGVGCNGRIPIMYKADKPVLWVCYAFIMPIIAFGLFGNILSFQILGYNRSRRNQSSTFYLRSLAIADSMTLLFNTLLMAQQMLLRPAYGLHPLNFISQLVGSYPMCNLRMYASHTTTLVSVYIIVLFSIERALVVINPFRWMRFFSLRKAKIAVTCLAVAVCFICIPSHFSFNKEYYPYPVRLYNVTTNATIEAPTLLVMLLHKCPDRNLSHLGIIAHLANASRLNASSAFDRRASEAAKTPTDRWSLNYQGLGLECQRIPECRINFPLFKYFILFHNIAQTIVPFIVTGICNLIIVTSLRRREAENLGKSRANEEQQDRQVTKKLIIVSTTFIVLGFPLALFHMITLAMTGSYCNRFWANAMTITICLNAVNYAINFIIYCISEEQFRKLVVSVLLCKRHRLKRLLSYINEPRNKRYGGGGARGTRGARSGTSTGGGRKNSNQLTNATNYSISQSKDMSDPLPVTDALVHHHTPQHHEPDVDEAACSFADEEKAEMANMLEEEAADYVVARHSKGPDDPVEKPHDFKNCSYVKDDYASELFTDDVEDAKLRAIMARWSEIAPE